MTLNDFNHLMNSIKGLSPDQARRLRAQLDKRIDSPAARKLKATKKTKPGVRKKNSMTREGFNRQLMDAGLITSLPDPSLDVDDDDPEDAPVTIKGEPLSETIIRERR
jgi:hypothetical protein